MAEKMVEVRTFLVRLMCDQPWCGGELQRSGRILLSNPPQFPHVCNQCGWECVPDAGKVYPSVVYRERVEGEE